MGYREALERAGHRQLADFLYGTRVSNPVSLDSRRPDPGYLPARPAGQRSTQRRLPRFSAPVPLRAATSNAVDGERLDFDGMVEPDGSTPLLWMHRGEPIGVVDSLRLGDFDLTAGVRFDLDTAKGRECDAARQRGQTLHASVGFAALDVDERGWVRRWSLSDISVVPAGRSADRGAFTPAWMLPPRAGAHV